MILGCNDMRGTQGSMNDACRVYVLYRFHDANREFEPMSKTLYLRDPAQVFSWHSLHHERDRAVGELATGDYTRYRAAGNSSQDRVLAKRVDSQRYRVCWRKLDNHGRPIAFAIC